MKNKKNLFRILAALMSLALVLGALFVLGTASVGATEEQESETIQVPDIPSINRPYRTIEELGLDFEKIDSYFPQNIEVRYEDGKVYVEDIGATFVEVHVNNDYVALELIDGYWTAELGAEPMFVYVEYYEDSKEEGYLKASYHGNGTRDPYIVFYSHSKDTYVNFSYEYRNVIVQYSSGDCDYEDRYEEGVLNTHGVSNRQDIDIFNEVLYGVDGKIHHCTLYTDTIYYYFPGQGWSSTWGEFTAGDTPEGYENIDETYFTANKLSLICSEAEGKDDIVHDMSIPYCTAPSTCKNGCGYTVGTIEHHDWQTVDGEKVCSICDAVFFPEFDFVDRIYPTVEETNFPYYEYRILFPDVLTVKYEDGKYMIKDVGADRAEASSTGGYVDISLVDGWWIYELDEEIYNDESVGIFVTFRGENDNILWNLNYYNGKINGSIYVESKEAALSVRVYYEEYDRVAFMHYVGGRRYTDNYHDGVFSSQEVITHYGDDELNIYYYADGTVESIYVYSDGNWSYYYPDRGWENSYREPIDAPEGYENIDVKFLASVAPTTINCAHEAYGEADCTNPECCLVCGIAKEGSKPLDHDVVIDESVEPTCTDIGFTEGSHCSRCGEIIVAQEEIPTTDHEYHARWIDPTCTEAGGIEDFCLNCSWEMRDPAEQVPALGHDYVDGICSRCNETEVETETDTETETETENNGSQGGTNRPQGGNQNQKPEDSETETEKNPTETENGGEETPTESETDKKGADATESGDKNDKKGGCGSSISVGAIAIVSIFGAVGILFKKKED